jgi:DNA-binding response OmpR family regulator/DNA-binding CsgD family transcriptional regulator
MNGRQGTVMIVDDAPGNLALLSDALEDAGFRVLVATDGYSALEQLQYVTPDIILMDGMMPGMDGFETCRHIKANPATQPIPVLFMTALGELDDLLRGFDEGAIDYIVKPFRHEEVVARVRTHLNQARLIRRIGQALSGSGLAALAVDTQGQVTWSTQSASAWLTGDADRPKLPKPLLEWALPLIQAKHRPGDAGSLSFDFSCKGWTAKMSPCHDRREFLVFLQKQANDWDLESLKGSLGLTFKEAEVLMWISRGKTNREIGLILGNSPRTVNKHMEHIFEKLGVATRSAAIALVMAQIGRT